MNKTVGMITIYRLNYGAFLQAYALQQTILSNGMNPEIIRYDYYRDHSILTIGLEELHKPLCFLKHLAVEILRFKPHRERAKIFEKSIEKNIYESSTYYRTYKSLEKNPPKYDIYLTGSDQVFNPELTPHANRARLLCFVKEGKKASYAASAGKAAIPEKYNEFFKSALQSFDMISVREEGLRLFLKNEYNISTYQNIDPTFLLTKKDWRIFSERDESVKGEYIFYYRVQQQETLRIEAEKLSKKTGLPVYVADGHDKFENQISRKGILSPEEWVGMLDNACYVITNSFHGAAFSLNFEKKAVILTPPVWGDRIKLLFENCGFPDTAKIDTISKDGSDIFAQSRNYFETERRKAQEFFLHLKNLDSSV